MKKLKIKTLLKGYKNFKLIFRNQVFESGKINILFGPNGVGKTTFFYSLLNLKIPDLREFEYVEKNTNIIIKDHIKLKQKLMFIPEENMIYEYFKGKEFIKFFLSGFNKEYNKAQVLNEGKKWNINEKILNKKIKNYSKGMKKKILLMANILRNPEIIIMDEFDTGLDAWSLEYLREWLINQKRQDKIIILSTHIIDIIENFGDNITIIKQGKNVLNESIENIKKKDTDFRKYILNAGFLK